MQLRIVYDIPGIDRTAGGDVQHGYAAALERIDQRKYTPAQTVGVRSTRHTPSQFDGELYG